MWTKNYKKAITFSFDDGVYQDIRLVEILNRYGLKATFNINTGLSSTKHDFVINDVNITHLSLDTMVKLYQGHEVAMHTHTHPDLTACDLKTIKDEIKKNFDVITQLFKKEPIGFVYPYGTFNDEIVKELSSFSIKYARTIIDNYDTNLQNDLLRFRPTAHFNDPKLTDIVDTFLNASPETPQILYIWGHSYECDTDNLWSSFESLCQKISNKNDVFYGTNKDVLII